MSTGKLSPTETLREIVVRLPNNGGAWDDVKIELKEIINFIDKLQNELATVRDQLDNCCERCQERCTHNPCDPELT